MNYLGIDPGASGGIAVIGERGATAYAMPTTDRDVYELLRDLARDGAVAVLEQVGVVPGNGSLGYFKLGRSYGFIQGCLAALDIPFLEVVPRRWQGALECASARPAKPHAEMTQAERATVKREHKNALKAMAQRLFPSAKVTLSTADALLLAVYCSRQDWRGVRAA